MNTGIYGIAGAIDDRTKHDGKNVETVAYEKTGDTWAWDSTDVTHIGE